MFTIDCPLCEEPRSADPTAPDMACDGCGVTLEFAPDQAPPFVLAAAA
jgi:hypothetical protein